jgi:phosphate transport system permease protein
MLRKIRDNVGIVACWASAAIIIIVLVGIVGFLLNEGLGVLNLGFLTSEPTPDLTEAMSGGILTPIGGTIILAVLGILAVIPPALGSAVYLSEYLDEGRALTRGVRLGLEVLAGVPSVVFGMWGLALFSMPIFSFLSDSTGNEGAASAFGRSFIIGAIVMAIHILPFVIKVMEESIRAVPRDYRAGAAALGMTKWRTISKVVLPAARPGLLTAIILGMGLIIGDTAIVWLTVGGSMTMSGAANWWLPQHWIDTIFGTGSTLTTFIYYSSPAGEGNAPTKAYAAAVVLMAVVFALNLTVEALARSRSIRRD